MIDEDISAMEIAAALMKMNLYDENSEDIDFEDDFESTDKYMMKTV